MSCVTLNIVPDKNVVVLSIDANKVNVISPKFIKDVSEALDTILKAPEYKNLGVVITGNKKCFSAGLDLSVLQGADAQGAMKYINGVDLFFYKIFTFPRPVVAAINGHAIAGGTLIAAACDYRISNGKGKTGMNEMVNGFNVPHAMTEILRFVIPRQVWKWMLEGKLWNMQQAHADGFIDELVDDNETLMQRAIARAHIEAKSVMSYVTSKENLQRFTRHIIESKPNETTRVLVKQFGAYSKL